MGGWVPRGCWCSLRATVAGRARGRPRTHFGRCQGWYVATSTRRLARVRPVAATETRLCKDGGRTTWWCSGSMRETGGMPLRQNCIW